MVLEGQIYGEIFQIAAQNLEIKALLFPRTTAHICILMSLEYG